MILLILLSDVKANPEEFKFKFHCDSINMNNFDNSEKNAINLNSTVILLISMRMLLRKQNRHNLNSTVILLILMERATQNSRRIFKFHCDSINIKAKTSYIQCFCIFKFHCDSINMAMIKKALKGDVNLNSTVILLI